jgi:hypothetical protein
MGGHGAEYSEAGPDPAYIEAERRQANLDKAGALYGAAPKDFDPAKVFVPQVNTQNANFDVSNAAGKAKYDAKLKLYKDSLRMGSKLNANLNEEANAAAGQATQDNLEGTSSALTQANAFGASIGNMGSVNRKVKAGVMGGYLQGTQNIASAKGQIRTQGAINLDASRRAMETATAGGNIDAAASAGAYDQIQDIRRASSGIPIKVMGNALVGGTNIGVNSALMNAQAQGYQPNIYGNALTSGSKSGQGQLVDKGQRAYT